LQQQLQRWREGKVTGKAPALEPVRKQVQTISSAQFLKLILHSQVRAVRQGLELTYSTDQGALERLWRIEAKGGLTNPPALDVIKPRHLA
jgi:hypothetical protein